VKTAAGGNAWTQVAPQLNSQTMINQKSIAVLNNKIYAGTDGGRLFEWDGVDEWVQVAPQLDSEGINSIASFNGKIYGGTGSDGNLYEWNGTNACPVRIRRKSLWGGE
jgi:hypothetical protein